MGLTRVLDFVWLAPPTLSFDISRHDRKLVARQYHSVHKQYLWPKSSD